MSAPNWTTRDRWRDVRLGVGIGIVLAFSVIAYSTRLTSALHALGSPRPAMASAPVLAAACPKGIFSPAAQLAVEDFANFLAETESPAVQAITNR